MSSLLVAGALALSTILGGCGSSNNGGNQPTTTNKAANTEQVSTPNNAGTDTGLQGGKYDPPITITYLRPWGPDVQFKSGEDQDNNVHATWAKEQLGIELKNQWVSPSTNNAFETKLRLSWRLMQRCQILFRTVVSLILYGS